MDRREWLTIIYREANLFVRDNRELVAKVTGDNIEIEILQPALWKQLRAILSDAESLNDLIKFSLLKEPEPELWMNETHWEGVLIGVALACLTFDVLGLVTKIIDGELPEVNPDTIMDFNPHEKMPMSDDTTFDISRGPSGG